MLLAAVLTITIISMLLLSFGANAKVKLAKTGHGPHCSTLVVICVVRLLFCVVLCIVCV